MDRHYRFLVIAVGGSGQQNDKKTFIAFDLIRMMEDNTHEIPEPAYLPVTNVKAHYVLVGDDAYPLLPNLLKPYARDNLGFDGEMFNKRLSRMRKSVE